jgi:predicted AlkP superfamily pyrophosphatase or phosphodiesterase
VLIQVGIRNSYQSLCRIKVRKSWRAALALVVALVTAGAPRIDVRGQSKPAADATARHVIVISVDGMRARCYVSPSSGLRIPNLLRMKSEGSFAEAVQGVYPSVTYPSHTTIVTGRMPAEHGIYTNLSSRQAGKNPLDWFWFANAIKVPTLWDEARKAHLTTASVFWPVTAGAAIDWDLPEIWDPLKGEVGDPMYIAKFATPGLLLEALMTLGPPPAGEDNDLTRAHLAEFLIKQHKPNLLLVHLDSLDEIEHQHGPESAEAAATLERIDARLGEIVDAVKAAGLQDSTDFFIVSDHGFMTVDRVIQPNVLLANAGLLSVDEHGDVIGGKIATVSNGGSFFIYWPDGEDLQPAVDAALKPLRDQGLAWRVFDRQALRKMGADPEARMAIEAPQGARFGTSASGALVTKMSAPSGSHGYLPDRPGLEASFIAWGPRIKSGVNLHRIHMTSIAATLLEAIGITDSTLGSQPALKQIFN